MRIAVDVMGGDLGPQPIIEGALLAAKESIEVILVGDKGVINNTLKNHKIKKLPIFIQDASEVVEMTDSPSKVVRSKKNSSLSVSINLLKDGNAKACLTAGNTGAALVYGMHLLKGVAGIQRPAIAVILPTLKKRVILLDVGGNVDCKPIHLFQFAIMGSLLSKNLFSVKSPSVALLSNGEEENKGNEIVRHTSEMLQKSSLNYIGFKEGRDIFEGAADVFVCDGFVGNICLKLSESLGANLLNLFYHEINSSFLSKVGSLFMRKSLSKIKEQIDYREYGSAPLLGLNGTIFVSHGTSDAICIYNGIKHASEFVGRDFNLQLSKELGYYGDIEKRGFWTNIKERINFPK